MSEHLRIIIISSLRPASLTGPATRPTAGAPGRRKGRHAIASLAIAIAACASIIGVSGPRHHALADEASTPPTAAAFTVASIDTKPFAPATPSSDITPGPMPAVTHVVHIIRFGQPARHHRRHR